jgi:hypothetical protein
MSGIELFEHIQQVSFYFGWTLQSVKWQNKGGKDKSKKRGNVFEKKVWDILSLNLILFQNYQMTIMTIMKEIFCKFKKSRSGFRNLLTKYICI